MKLLELRIEQFGASRQLAMACSTEAPTVIHGPNEAGKTTLIGFLRYLLYGQAALPKAARADAETGGSLEFETEAGRFHLERLRSAATGEERFRLLGPQGELPAEHLATHILAKVDQATFSGVYAFGLDEMHALGGLEASELACHLYELTLGPEGRRLLRGLARVRAARGALIDPLQHEGRLVRLFEEHDQLESEIARARQHALRHADLRAARTELERQIAELQSRKAGLESQLRGHKLLEQAWRPWNRMRECDAELAQLPAAGSFPERGLERWSRLELALGRAKEQARRAGGRLRRTLKAASLEEQLARQRAAAPGMRGFVAQQEWLGEVKRQIEQAARRVDEAEYEFESRREALGPDCTIEQLWAVDPSVEARGRLLALAESLQRARARRARLAQRARRLRDARRELSAALQASIEAAGAGTLKQAVQQASQDLEAAVAHTSEAARLDLLLERRSALCALHAAAARQLELPRWVYAVLAVFCFLGVVLAGWGLVSAVAASALAGGVYALLGISCVTLAQGIRTQCQEEARGRMEELRAGLAAVEREIDRVQSLAVAAARAQASAAGAERALPGGAKPQTGVEPILRAAARLAELAELAHHERRLAHLTSRLATTRRKLQGARQELATARANLRQQLAARGFQLAEPIDRAAATLPAVWEAASRLRELRHCQRELALWQQAQSSFEESLARFCARHGIEHSPATGAPSVLESWNEQLAQWDAADQQRALARRACALLRKKLRKRLAQIRRLRMRRAALLVRSGAANAAEFLEQGRALARRAYLEDQRADAKRELEQAALGYQDLAVSEEDLLAYDPSQNARCLDALEGELHDIEHDLRQAHEELGGLRQHLKASGGDRTGTVLRFRREQVLDRLLRAAREWCAIEWAAEAVDALCREYALRHQPQALAEASRYFEQLTEGRFKRLWTPLDRQQICVEDAGGASMAASGLSRGTREQLFLALRLALVMNQRRDGVLLPFIMDDVLVNFDHRRAQAAVDLLCRLAAQGQQILYFTCHDHLVRLFEVHGAALRPLDASAALDAREQRRLAG